MLAELPWVQRSCAPSLAGKLVQHARVGGGRTPEEPQRVRVQSNLLQVTYGEEGLPIALSAAGDNVMIQKQRV